MARPLRIEFPAAVYHVMNRGAARQARPIWLAVPEALAEFVGRRAFHEFVLAGHDDALEEFYRAGGQMPILGSEQFREGVRGNEGQGRAGVAGASPA